MFLRHRSDEPVSRGQAMVEFAIILPLLMLILVFAIDFGRLFFGWVGLHNVARIGSNYAAMWVEETDWSNPADEHRVEYLAQIASDAAAINCVLPADADRLPDFPNGTDIGDEAVVSLECDFNMLTPLLAPLFGGTTVPLGATATFPIRAGIFAGPGGAPPGGGGPTCRVIPDMEDMLVADARAAWTGALFTGAFYPAGSAQNAEEVTDQYPNPFALPGQCVDSATSVTVASVPLPPPPCPSTEARVPQMVGLTVGNARSSWFAAGFNPGTFTPSNGQNGQQVQSQRVTPSTAAGSCAPKTATAIVTIGAPPVPDCTVPNFIGSASIGAQSTWAAARFTTTVSYRAPGQLPYIINEQTLVSDSLVPCNSNIQVGPG